MKLRVPSGMKRLGWHALIYTIGTVLGRVVSFVLLPLYTHFLTPADYGVMELIELTLDVVGIFAGTQLASGVFRFYHKAESDDDRRLVLSSAMVLLCGSFAVFAAITAIAAPFLSRVVLGSETYAGLIRIASATLGIQSLVTVPLAYLRLQERSLRFTYINILRLLLQLTLNITFVAVLHLGVRGILLSTLITNVVLALVLGIPFVSRVGLTLSPAWTRALLRYGIPLIGMNIATFVSTFGDRYFLRAQGNMTVVGLYTLSYQFGFLLMSLGFVPFSMMWQPAQFEVARRPDRDAVFARVFVYLNVALLTLAVGMSLFVGDFLTVMSSPAFHAAAVLVPIILLAYVLQAWSSFMEVGLLVRERTEIITLTNWVAAVTAVAGYVLLIPRWLGLGAAIATVLSFAVRAVMTYAWAQRLWPVRYQWTPVMKLTVIAAAFAAAGALAPRIALGWSLALHATLFVGYAGAVWSAGILSADDRARLRQSLLSPRQAVASLVT